MSLILQNQKPSISIDGFRLAIIGECPSDEDATIGRLFTGNLGRILGNSLNAAKVVQSSCFLGYIRNTPYQYSKSDAAIRRLLPDLALEKSLGQLRQELIEYDPNCVLLLGSETLSVAGVAHSMASYRGSLFICRETTSPFFGMKCIASFAPNHIMRSWDDKPLFDFDIRRAAEEAKTKDLVLPERVYDVELTADQIISKLDLINDGEFVSIDIEGGVLQGVTCVGIALSPSYAFIVNFNDFTENEQIRILKALARVLCSPKIPKILQNSLYDNFVLSWLWKMPIRNVAWDTMLSSWEIHPELPKGLGTQTSIWTRTPYYKFERTVNDKLTHYRYCCTDAAVTFEIAEKHQKVLAHNPSGQRHFEFNMSLLPPMHYMELRGIRYNAELAREKHSELTLEMKHLQTQIDTQVGGQLNINSPKQMVETIYKKLRFEPQYVVEKGRKTTKLTTDVEALLTLFRKTDSALIHNILVWRQLEATRKQLEVTCDADGRMRCSYNLVGTETGRLNCGESPTGNGTNLQTITKKLRVLYQADPGKLMFQCDLSGADGWTVAAHCKALGDSTMWNDYLFGLKPARIIAAMQVAQAKGHSITRLPREELAAYIKQCEIPSWLYEACKAVQHGSNYGMKKNTMSSNILKQSWKKSGAPLYVSPSDCEALQNLYLNHRYIGVSRWHAAIEKQLRTTAKLPCCSGHTRTFFGRLNDNTTVQAALAHEPQANTTYVTNKALERLWNDPENRRPDNSLIIEPLHQVHDALIGQYDESIADWANAKIREWFNNPVTIAGTELIIPFEGGYGSDWLNLDNPI